MEEKKRLEKRIRELERENRSIKKQMLSYRKRFNFSYMENLHKRFAQKGENNESKN